MAKDEKTASAFASSWNNLPQGSVYTAEQFEDWFAPLTESDITDRRVLELGCGNGSLLVHAANWKPSHLTGVDLGDSVRSAKSNLEETGFRRYEILKEDLTAFESDGFDLVYSIGVLHHLKDPLSGFQSVIRNTRAGGRFQCWVYAEEGNSLVIYAVDPIRTVVSNFPWWFTKYLVATPLAFVYFIYAHLIVKLRLSSMPLFEYSKWIVNREFSFFRHVAFDQLVTPQTSYLNKKTIEKWLASDPAIDQESTYIIFRNGNSWKFGGKKRS